jgi:hypothetical protein
VSIFGKQIKINNMNNYMGDTRYEKVWEQMQLLGIEDVTSKRQAKNGTRVWRLPIKNINNRKPSYIEVASFATGYVRNQNSGYSNYQLNKRCETDTQYYPESEWVDGDWEKTGKFLPFSCRGCILIPNEIDRLEYLIGYCLKNYYVKRANFVPDGEYIPKWRYDNLADAARLDYDKRSDETDSHYTRIVNLELQNEVLQNKLQSIIRTARH